MPQLPEYAAILDEIIVRARSLARRRGRYGMKRSLSSTLGRVGYSVDIGLQVERWTATPLVYYIGLDISHRHKSARPIVIRATIDHTCNSILVSSNSLSYGNSILGVQSIALEDPQVIEKTVATMVNWLRGFHLRLGPQRIKDQ